MTTELTYLIITKNWFKVGKTVNPILVKQQFDAQYGSTVVNELWYSCESDNMSIASKLRWDVYMKSYRYFKEDVWFIDVNGNQRPCLGYASIYHLDALGYVKDKLSTFYDLFEGGNPPQGTLRRVSNNYSHNERTRVRNKKYRDRKIFEELRVKNRDIRGRCFDTNDYILYFDDGFETSRFHSFVDDAYIKLSNGVVVEGCKVCIQTRCFDDVDLNDEWMNKLKMSNRLSQCFYVFIGEDKLKIGISKTPQSRLEKMISIWGEFNEVIIYRDVGYGGGGARHIESKFKKILRGYSYWCDVIQDSDGYTEMFTIDALSKIKEVMATEKGMVLDPNYIKQSDKELFDWCLYEDMKLINSRYV